MAFIYEIGKASLRQISRMRSSHASDYFALEFNTTASERFGADQITEPG
jgi:hypothetical protein